MNCRMFRPLKFFSAAQHWGILSFLTVSILCGKIYMAQKCGNSLCILSDVYSSTQYSPNRASTIVITCHLSCKIVVMPCTVVQTYAENRPSWLWFLNTHLYWCRGTRGSLQYGTSWTTNSWRSLTYTSTMPSNFALWLIIDCQNARQFWCGWVETVWAEGLKINGSLKIQF